MARPSRQRAERDAGVGQGGAGQLGRGRRVLGLTASLLDRGGRHHARSRAHAPTGRRETVPFGRDDDEVGTGQREVDCLLPPVDPHGPTHQGVEHRFGRLATAAGPHVGPDGLGAAAGRRVLCRGCLRRVRVTRGQHRTGDAALAQCGQRGLGRAPPVDDDGGHPRAGGRLEGGLPSFVDLDQVDQRADDSVDLTQELAPAGTLQIGQGTFERLRPCRRAVPGLLGRVGVGLGGLRRRRGRHQLGAAGRQVRLQGGPGLLELGHGARLQVGPYRSGRVAPLERLDPGALPVDVLLLAAGGPGHQLAPRAHRGNGLVGFRGVAQSGRPPSAQCDLLDVHHVQGALELRPLRSTARGQRLGLGGRELGGQPGRLGLEGGDHVLVGRRVQCGRDAAAPFAQHAGQAPGPLHQTLDPAQGIRQVLLPARGQLGRGRRRLGVELFEGGVQLDLLVPAHGQVLPRAGAGP